MTAAPASAATRLAPWRAPRSHSVPAAKHHRGHRPDPEMPGIHEAYGAVAARLGGHPGSRGRLARSRLRHSIYPPTAKSLASQSPQSSASYTNEAAAAA